MIHIGYKLSASDLHGVGLFANENIKRGQTIYTARPLFDLNITQEQFDTLDQKEKDEILWWGFFDQPSQMWHVDFDVSKFINHSYDPAVTQDKHHNEAYLVAKRDIKTGEELTQNYLEFETQEELARRGIMPQAMRFTMEQINDIHDRLGNADTLLAYAQELHALGVEHADSYLTDGHSEFFGKDGYTVRSTAEHETFLIAKKSDKQNFLRHLKLHELGKTSYVEMSKGLADSGIEKWIIDTRKLTMTFYDKADNELLVDKLE